jgi:hypothetical protein
VILLLLAGLVLAAQPDAATAFDGRMAASASAAERLQGPLDGAWVVRDRRGRDLLRLEIDDPPQNSRPPTGAWQAVDGSAMAPIGAIQAAGGALQVEITPAEHLVLERHHGLWRGRLTADGRATPVTLERN